MKKFIPFKREIPFKTNISEITSISLEHNIHKSSDHTVDGDFIVSGEYKVTDTSVTTENFKLELPFEIEMSDIYVIDNIVVDIDDFYYEIKNDRNLEVNITLLIDKIIEKPLIEEVIDNETVYDLNEEIEDVREECYEPEPPVTREEIQEEIIQDDIPILETKNIFTIDDGEEEYATYKVYIVRESDTVESIIERYQITREKLMEYNDVKSLKIGDKLIIPNV